MMLMQLGNPQPILINVAFLSDESFAAMVQATPEGRGEQVPRRI